MTQPHLASAMLQGNTLFLSGQIAFDDKGQVSGNVAQQTLHCLQRLEEVLRNHGHDRSAIIKTTVWLTERTAFGAFNDAYAAFFGAHRPARSTVIAGLAIDGAVVEIEAIADLSL